MKYIRTKSFITDFESWMKIDGDILAIGGAKHKIIAQADTIPELCDKFVMIDTNFGNIVVPDMEAIRFNLSERGYVHYYNEIYGAIWTDRGLIYVAKMKGILPNGEIDWELL